MFANYLKVALKVLARRRFFTFISLFGISFTLVVLMVLTAIVDHVLAPKPPQVNIDRTLRISYMLESGENVEWNGEPGFGLLDRYCRDLPGVEMMSIVGGTSSVVGYPEGRRTDLKLRHTDGVYWDAYDFRFLEGAPYTREDDRVGRPVAVITEAASREYFGESPAVGQSIALSGRTYEVLGVVANVSPVYDLAYSDVWVPIGTIPDPSFREALMGSFEGVLVAESRDAFPAIRDDFAARLERVTFPPEDEFSKLEGFPMTPIETVAVKFFSDRPSRNALRKFTGMVAALVLAFMLLPAINLVNVNLSRIYERTSEIGVRKAFGASSRHLIHQFVLENVVLCLVGGVIGLVLSAAVLAAVNASGLVPYAHFTVSLRVFVVGIALATFFGILSGLFPAWRMSRVHPVAALKGETG
ncbi:MAG: FtsX-like permease family protein [bacterium]